MHTTDMGAAIRIDLTSGSPAYRQIADGLRALLVGGELRPGQRLATVRELALELGINHNTVAEAYRLLAEEGWLSLERAKGAVVVERRPAQATEAVGLAYLQRMEQLVAEARAAGVPVALLREQLGALQKRLKALKEEDP